VPFTRRYFPDWSFSSTKHRSFFFETPLTADFKGGHFPLGYQTINRKFIYLQVAGNLIRG
jgi:hypothetical protein